MAYDAGLLNDYGGGNVEWWQDYIRTELDRSHDYYAAELANLRATNMELVAQVADANARETRLREATNQCRLAFAGMVSVQSAINKLDSLGDPT